MTALDVSLATGGGGSRGAKLYVRRQEVHETDGTRSIGARSSVSLRRKGLRSKFLMPGSISVTFRDQTTGRINELLIDEHQACAQSQNLLGDLAGALLSYTDE